MMEKKVFIIEDDVNNLCALQAKLSLEGFIVKIDNGDSKIEEILTKIKLFKPDCIILDLILPQADGFEILTAVKGDKEISGVSVFIFTNLSDNDSKSRGEQLGADYFFIKNKFLIDEFVEKFKKIIHNKQKISAK